MYTYHILLNNIIYLIYIFDISRSIIEHISLGHGCEGDVFIMPGMSSRSEQASNRPVNTQKLSWHTWVQEKEQANNQTTPVKSIRLTQVTNNKHSLRTPPNCLLGSPHPHTISVEGLSLWWLSSMYVVVVGVGGWGGGC